MSCAALALSWCLRSGLPIQTTPSQGLHVRSLTGLVDGRRLGQMNWIDAALSFGYRSFRTNDMPH